MLGGVEVPHETGLIGHSDADVLLHAVTDALLGAAGLGDIGDMFPDTDPAYSGADSAELLAAAFAAVGQRNWRIVNLDCTLFAERPKLTPYKDSIKQRLSQLLDVPAECVNVKAKTGEQVGPVGREEAIAAEAAVLEKKSSGG